MDHESAATRGVLEMARRVAAHNLAVAADRANAAGWDRESKDGAIDALAAYQEAAARLESFLAAERRGGRDRCSRHRPWTRPQPLRIA